MVMVVMVDMVDMADMVDMVDIITGTAARIAIVAQMSYPQQERYLPALTCSITITKTLE